MTSQPLNSLKRIVKYLPMPTRSPYTPGMKLLSYVGFSAMVGLLHCTAFGQEFSHLPGTAPLEMEGDVASHLVDGVGRFLLKKLEASIEPRRRHWNRDHSSPTNYTESVEPMRRLLARQVGLRDTRVSDVKFHLDATVARSARVAEAGRFHVDAVSWPAFRNVRGEGLLLTPKTEIMAQIVLVPDAGQTPEDLCGLKDTVPPDQRIACRLASNGCRVVVPTLISRDEYRPKLSNREFLYRSAFELGRHLIGYEIHKVSAAVEAFKELNPELRTGVCGWGEGGLVALYSAATDTRIDAALVSGYFNSRQGIWREPIDRNVFGLLEKFGDAEIASLVVPRHLTIEASRGPERVFPGGRGAPATLETPALAAVRREVERAIDFCGQFKHNITLTISGSKGLGACYSEKAVKSFLGDLDVRTPAPVTAPTLDAVHHLPDIEARHRRQFDQLDAHNQWLLAESPYTRKNYMKNMKTDSLEAFTKSMEPYRRYFSEEIIGRFEDSVLPPAPRSRKAYSGEGWDGYEVVLDVFPDVVAYGVLLLPRDMSADEKRPVVVCQHGLEGRPADVIEGDKDAYHDFAAKLAERGFITFAPQNLYIFRDRFRTLQRKANPLKKTLFSVIVPQHQQIVDWLKAMPGVDPERIAFYGLSYGGKTAMRVPPLVPGYCLSICSADFNDWVWKNASSRSPYSYAAMGEYEIFEFDLGSTFNYSEMAALIAPRPFMVERGHFDGVAPDERVALEFAKVRRLYQAELGLGDRCEIEWFVGPHTINGKGTFEFLHKHLNWPEK